MKGGSLKIESMIRFLPISHTSKNWRGGTPRPYGGKAGEITWMHDLIFFCEK
jgi:hypothetical protein